jgi:hypothetical protein
MIGVGEILNRFVKRLGKRGIALAHAIDSDRVSW